MARLLVRRKIVLQQRMLCRLEITRPDCRYPLLRSQQQLATIPHDLPSGGEIGQLMGSE